MPAKPAITDEEILNLFRSGENRHYAFNLLMQKYQEKVYFFARRMVTGHEDANDVVQNIFLKVWNNLDNFRQDSKLFTWIYRIAVNESLSYLKSKQLRALTHLSGYEERQMLQLTDDNFFTGDEIQKKFHEAVIRLPNKQKTIFNMRYFDDLTYEEISAITGTSVGALKASYHIAVKKIQESVTGN